MRTHGWQGEPPASDEEAVARILAATHRCVEKRGAQTTLGHVAAELGVSRATVYRYFPSTAVLLRNAAGEGTRRFVERIGQQLSGYDDPAEAVIEGIVQTIAAVPSEPYLQLLLDEPTHTLMKSITSAAARTVGQAVLIEHTSIDWTRIAMDSAMFDELLEWALRAVQSFLSDPGDPPRTTDELRAYLRRWLAPAIREWVDSSGFASYSAK